MGPGPEKHISTKQDTKDLSKDFQHVTPAKYSQSPIITVIVGRNGKARTFTIHRDLLMAYSGYFKSCLAGSWEEARSHRVILQDDDPAAFDVVVNWLYREPDTMRLLQKDSRYLIIPPYKIADRLMMPLLKNDLLDGGKVFWLSKGRWPSLNAANLVYAAGLATTPLYDFVLKVYVTALHSPDPTGHVDLHNEAVLNPKLMEHLIRTLRDYFIKKWDDPRMETGCAYHDHSDGSECTLLQGTKRKFNEITS